MASNMRSVERRKKANNKRKQIQVVEKPKGNGVPTVTQPLQPMPKAKRTKQQQQGAKGTDRKNTAAASEMVPGNAGATTNSNSRNFEKPGRATSENPMKSMKKKPNAVKPVSKTNPPAAKPVSTKACLTALVICHHWPSPQAVTTVTVSLMHGVVIDR